MANGNLCVDADLPTINADLPMAKNRNSFGTGDTPDSFQRVPVDMLYE